ncbi:Glycoside hydrolase, family 5, conserved site [Phytophthora cactorum]|nr:Glycoside hydrolase, family 5, conserved site [Phytophthora cactorum]
MQREALRQPRYGDKAGILIAVGTNSPDWGAAANSFDDKIQNLLINQDQETNGVTGNTLVTNDCKQLVEADVMDARSDEEQKSLCGNSCYDTLNAKYKIMLDNDCYASDDADEEASGKLQAAAYQIACQTNVDGKYCSELVKEAGASFSLCNDIVSKLGCCFQSYRQYMLLGTAAKCIAMDEAQKECTAVGVGGLDQMCPCGTTSTPSATPHSVHEKDVLSIKDGHFVDQHGRVALLRGVNSAARHTDDQDMSNFFDGAASVSFIGPLGSHFLRFIVTWEAIEHAGPGQIDHEYLKYIRAVVEKAADYNMQVYIDPHQDVWSRWTGGDGAPMWTLECIGFEPRNFKPTKAALCLETCGLPASKFPKMIWPTNYGKLACATMFTLFWAGKKYAPKCYVDGVQIQEYLQSHYLDSLVALAEALKGLANVVGFGTMNEPSSGFIGVKDLTKSGIAQDVDVWNSGIMTLIRGKPSKVEIVDPKGVRAWKEGFGCVWKEAGGKPQLLKPDYFSGVDFGKEFYVPFAKKFTKRLQQGFPNAMIFVEMPPVDFGDMEFPQITNEDIPNAVNAMHWYDGITLLTTTWRSYFTVDFATGKPAFGNKALRSFGRKKMNNAPTLIGETGIPYNMNDARAYISGDYSAQIEAMDNTISNLESQLLSYTYLWNLEDLSISSPDSEALAVRLAGGHTRRFARPYARKITGVPLKSTFTMATAEYVLEYVSVNSETSAPTEIYVPYVHYPGGYRVTSSDGHCTIKKHENYDIVTYAHDVKAHKHRVIVSPRTPLVVT